MERRSIVLWDRSIGLPYDHDYLSEKTLDDQIAQQPMYVYFSYYRLIGEQKKRVRDELKLLKAFLSLTVDKR